MQYTLTTAPTVEPITTAEAKAHLRVTVSDDDTYIDSLIKAARHHIETAILNRALVAQTWTLYLDAFPINDDAVIELPIPPLISVTSVQYYDDNDVLQTWSSAEYTVDTDSMKGRIYPGRTYSYPVARDYPKSVVITYQAGYEDSGASPQDLADNIPEPIKQALLIMVAHWYEHREPVIVGTNVAEVPMSARTLLAPYRVITF